MISQGAESNAMLVKSITHYNSQIATRIKTFKSKNSGVKAIVVDTSVAFKKAIKSPQNYGAPNALCYNADGKSCVSQVSDDKIRALNLSSFGSTIIIRQLLSTNLSRKMLRVPWKLTVLGGDLPLDCEGQKESEVNEKYSILEKQQVQLTKAPDDVTILWCYMC
jgi:hypothetical protein